MVNRIYRTAVALCAAIATTIASTPAIAAPRSITTSNGVDWAHIRPGGLGTFPAEPTRSPMAGSVTDSEDVELMGSNQMWKATAKQFHYTSTDSTGRPSIDRAIFIEPTEPWKGDGPRPLVAFAPGTQGTGPQCDPSESIQEGIAIRFTNPPDVIMPYEALSIGPHLALGAAVVMIDHHRNNDTGTQEYMDNINSGQSLLDAAVAVRDLGVSEKAPVAIYGYSQGGATAGAAAQMVASYAPGLNVVAHAVGGPPADLLAVMDGVDGTLMESVLSYSLEGVLAKDPGLRDHIYNNHLTEEGRELFSQTNERCLLGSPFTVGFKHSSQLTQHGESLRDIVDMYPPILAEFDRQKLGRKAPAAPTLLWNGTGDDIIPVGQVRQLRDDWIAGGAEVHYFETPLPMIPGKTALGHAIPALAHLDYTTKFLWDRLDPNHTRSTNRLPAPLHDAMGS